MPDLLVDNKTIYNLEYNFITAFSYITKISLVLFMVGIFQSKPSYLIEINFFIKVLIALFLIYRFNSHRTKKIVFTELDRKVVYSAGTYILLISFIDISEYYLQLVRSNITPYTLPVITYLKEKMKKYNIPIISLEQ
jgi:hypothetical protein